MPPETPVLLELPPEAREEAVPIVKDGFEGYYRWHAKRTLRDIELVRGIRVGGRLAGVTMLQELAPGVGYVFYVVVHSEFRRRGLAGALLDDALQGFQARRLQVVYAAAEEENLPSRRLFESRGFRLVTRDEPNYQEGGLGAHGLRTRMRVISGEVLMGRRFAPQGPSRSATLSG